MLKILKNLLPILLLMFLVLGCKQINNLVKENLDSENEKRPRTSERDPFEDPNDEITKLSVDKTIDGLPIPSDSNVSSNEENPDNPFSWKRRIKLTNSASVSSVAKFYETELKQKGWNTDDDVRDGSIIANLDFEKDSEEIRVYVSKGRNNDSEAEITSKEKFPMHPKSSGGNQVTINGKMTLTTNVPENKKVVADFYKETLTSKGWKDSEAINSGETTILNFSRNSQKIMITLSGSGNSTSVSINM